MRKFTKKQNLYAHLIEARRQRERYGRIMERHEDAGNTERADTAYRKACEWGAKESAFTMAIAIVCGESSEQLNKNLKAFEEGYMPETPRKEAEHEG